MNKLAALPILSLALLACAPAATTQPVTPPVVYAASQDAVFAAVINEIVTDPGVPAYRRPFNPAGENMERIPTGPWQIVSSDKAGGFIRAQGSSTLVTTYGGDSGQREYHTLSATITGTADRTQVVITASTRGTYLRDKIFVKLNSMFALAK